MTSLQRLLCSVLGVLALLVSAWFGMLRYGAEQHRAGYVAAVKDGEATREAAAVAALAVESGLRTRLLDQDTTAFQKEQEYATNLEAAQRRMRAGDDRLRCPAGAVSNSTAAGDRPAASGLAADGERPSIVPEVAADLLGIAADVGGILRRYDRVVERFEACRAMNAR